MIPWPCSVEDSSIMYVYLELSAEVSLGKVILEMCFCHVGRQIF